jgi:hypothetical protein
MKSNFKIQLEWKLQDFWLGVFWKRTKLHTDIWICLIPCIPIHITLWRVQCPRCDAIVKRVYTDSAGVITACCIECAWNPNGCRCRFGEFGVPDSDNPYAHALEDEDL